MKSKTDTRVADRKPLVSVIVPTWNSASTLEICLRSLKAQTYPDVEIVVVDNYSVDATVEIAKKYGVRIVEVDAARSEARNTGADEAKGEFVLFVDSDMALSSTVIEECVKRSLQGYDGIVIPEITIGTGFWADCRALEKLCYIGDETIEGARFYWKEAFKNVGGFDTDLLAGEEWDLNQRVKRSGFKIGRISAPIKHHEGKMALRSAMLKKHLYGTSLDIYMRKHPHDAKRHFSPFRTAFIRNWRMLARDPLHAIGLAIMKACELATWTMGFIESKLSKREESWPY